ncbi:MAG: hypothetical protein ABIS14_12800 [Sphingomonas sp.]
MVDLDKLLITSHGHAAVLRERSDTGAFSVCIPSMRLGTLWFYSNGEPMLTTSLLMGSYRFSITNAPESPCCTANMDQTVRKAVVGLRQIAAESVAIDDGAHSDRISGYATELADAIGYVEPSADLLAARELAAQDFDDQCGNEPDFARYVIMSHDGETLLATDDRRAILDRFRSGELDESLCVKLSQGGIARGRNLAAADAEKQRIADMAAAPRREHIAADRLTIFISGPQGAGKTRLAHWLTSSLDERKGRESTASIARLNPRVIELRDGREFDPVNEVFL